ncbi:MAG TPA: PAS domain S-box protein [Polyangia bacterium]
MKFILDNGFVERRCRPRERRARVLIALAGVAGLPALAVPGAAAAGHGQGHGQGRGRTGHARGKTTPPAPSPPAPAVEELSDPAAAQALNAPLTTAAAVRALSPERAQMALPVKVRGVITFAGSLIFIQDETAGIYIDAPVSTKGRYQVGQFGDLEGFTAPGLFAPQIVPRRFTVIGTTSLPDARPSKYDELSTGRLDSQRVEVEGIVRSVMPDERADLRRTVTLKMASDDGVFPVYVSDLPPDKLRAVVDASVRVRGVVGGVFNERRQMIGIKLYVGRPEDLTIEETAPGEPYSVPTTTVESLLRFRPEGANRHRVKVRGTVTLHQPGGAMYVEDGTGGVAVRTRQAEPLAVGDRVEVLGFPEMGPWTPLLNDAVFRRNGPAAEPLVPINVTADQELSAGAHDSRLVSLEAEVVDMVRDAGRLLLVAKAKNVLFDAELVQVGEVPAAVAANIASGSRVRLAGISVVRLGPDRDHPSEFHLLMRGLDDITVLQKPPWWTLGRLVWMLAVLAALTALAVAWGVILRRRVRAQTRIIQLRMENEAALAARYMDLFENANDVIYTHDMSGRLLTVNRAGELATGYTRDELLTMTIFDLALPARRQAISTWLQKLAAGEATRPTFEWELLSKSGRIIPFEVSIRAIVEGDEGAQITAVEGVARDTTERKRAEAELSAANQRLIETSRRAGMAEVAAGVLHNVGNVLTSVTASVAHLTDRLRVPGRAPDPEVGRDLEALGQSVEHIKEIVAMQQGYARLSGTQEEVAAETLIEDALRINREALERHRISVVREYAPSPLLLIEKHKVLQILVNLLGNAKYACDGRPADGQDARVVVRIDTPKGERAGNRVRIVVADNGSGIAHEHLGRIFENGFTTRKDGHGIGLYSASLTARELGGALFVHSDGVGRGARFTLDLPVRPPEAAVKSVTESPAPVLRS